MGQISKFLRNWEGGGKQGVHYWCQGCNDIHGVVVAGPGAWGYNANPEKPTFTPSVLTRGHRLVRDEHGHWTGEYRLDANGKPIEEVCHTFITNGMVQFLGDCTHALAGQTLPLPELPGHLRD